MREIQAYGRYFLYAVIWVATFQACKDVPAAQWLLVLAAVVGVPGYWFWTRARHMREHLDSPRDSCSHCRNRLTALTEAEKKANREAAMQRLNERYRD